TRVFVSLIVPAWGRATPFSRAYFARDDDFFAPDFFAPVEAFLAVDLAVVLPFDAAPLRPDRLARRAAPSREAFATCLPTSGAFLATDRPALATRLATGSARSATPFSAPG